MASAFPAAWSNLRSPQGYPHPIQAVEVIETHMSWVLLTGEFAYKLKRPVSYDFVDMRALEQRAYLCREELRLNARFAPELYLDVCKVTAMADGRVQIGGVGPVVDYAVRMRQFRRADELDRLLDARQVVPAELECFGQAVAALHAGLPAVNDQQPFGQPDRIAVQLRKNQDECLQAVSPGDDAGKCAALRRPLDEHISAAMPWLAARRVQGKVRECHGDLHCRNVVRLGDKLVGFDCLEFEPEFRWVDVAEDIALLLADMESRGCSDHAHAFLSGYLAHSGDYDACTGLNLYQAHHALVRAKVAAISARLAADTRDRLRWQRECHQLLRCAGGALGAHRPRLLLTCGLSGSGKTWLARQLAGRLRLLHLRSDVERKRSAGLAPQAGTGSPPGQGLYTAHASEALYQLLSAQAAAILTGGYSVVVDATFSHRRQRRLFQVLATQLGVPLCLIDCRAPLATLRTRIEQRQRSGGDPSESDATVLDWQLQHFEPVVAGEQLATVIADTVDTGVVDKIIATLQVSEAPEALQ
jgi:aminoglycoside phosphotransferase family enzyme/predicted kinase